MTGLARGFEPGELTDVLARASTTAPRETTAADRALKRAQQAISMLAALRRFDLIDALVVDIQKHQERYHNG